MLIDKLQEKLDQELKEYAKLKELFKTNALEQEKEKMKAASEPAIRSNNTDSGNGGNDDNDMKGKKHNKKGLLWVVLIAAIIIIIRLVGFGETKDTSKMSQEQQIAYAQRFLEELNYTEAKLAISSLAQDGKYHHGADKVIASIWNQAVEGQIGELVQQGHYVEAANYASSTPLYYEHGIHIEEKSKMTFYYIVCLAQYASTIYNTKGREEIEMALSVAKSISPGKWGECNEQCREANSSLDQIMAFLQMKKEPELIQLCKSLLSPTIETKEVEDKSYATGYRTEYYESWGEADRIKNKYK